VTQQPDELWDKIAHEVPNNNSQKQNNSRDEN
jgi:hypothetical protein